MYVTMHIVRLCIRKNGYSWTKKENQERREEEKKTNQHSHMINIGNGKEEKVTKRNELDLSRGTNPLEIHTSNE